MTPERWKKIEQLYKSVRALYRSATEIYRDIYLVTSQDHTRNFPVLRAWW